MTRRRTRSCARRYVLTAAIATAVAVLGAGCAKSESPARLEEAALRQAAARAFAADAGSSENWNVSNTDEINFADGFTAIQHDGKLGFRDRGFRWMGQRGTVRLKTHRGRAMRLFIYGWANVKVLQTRPVLTAYMDGRMIGTSPATEEGHWGSTRCSPRTFSRTKTGWS